MDVPDPAAAPRVRWTEDGVERDAAWRSERGAPPPARLVVVDDALRADDAYGLAGQGVALLWRGDYHNARQMLNALAHRVDRPRRPGRATAPAAPIDAFNRERQARSQRARTLGMLLVPLEADHSIPLRRAPDLRVACTEAWGPGREASLVSLRELLGVVGAHEWRVRGIPLAALGGARIHPWYGVFAPTRAEYVDLVARAPLPAASTAGGVAFDVGTGTGVLAAVLARRGVARVTATDASPRALACARENVERLGLAARVDVVGVPEDDPFPAGRAALVVCNPPWLPARPASPLEHAVYDPDGRMLRTVLRGLAPRLAPGGEGWLVMSDLAERLGLRAAGDLAAAFADAGLVVLGRLDARAAHPKAGDRADPLHAARAGETITLWRLGAA